MLSPSSRRAWIEIKYNGSMYKEFMVALLAEGVDRNRKTLQKLLRNFSVALLAEGVDRNSLQPCTVSPAVASPSSRRAWIEIFCLLCRAAHTASPSSRRAWIEIVTYTYDDEHRPSPSSRRAWIEIAQNPIPCFVQIVALLAEGVDRNVAGIELFVLEKCRPPRGGRG